VTAELGDATDVKVGTEAWTGVQFVPEPQPPDSASKDASMSEGGDGDAERACVLFDVGVGVAVLGVIGTTMLLQ
jgi:hypothetical protein